MNSALRVSIEEPRIDGTRTGRRTIASEKKSSRSRGHFVSVFAVNLQ